MKHSFIDTNILIYSYSSTEALKKNKSIEILTSVDEIKLSTQVVNDNY